MDCAAPDTFVDAAEWRAESGLPADLHDALLALDRALRDGVDTGCPTLNTDYMPFVYAGDCVTTNGYALTMDGIAWSGSDPSWSEAGVRWSATLAATNAADGTWPTGTITFESVDTSSGSGNYGGSSQAVTASWELEDAGTTALPLSGALDGEQSGSWGGCGGERAAYTGRIDTCAFASDWQRSGYGWSQGVFETHTFAAGTWSAEVRHLTCGTREGVLGERRARLDEAWGELPRTDADGDGCAAEDCDCDDTDASIHPSADDPSDDGVDRDCIGGDAAWSDDCATVVAPCEGAAADTGAPGTSPVDPPEATPVADPGCGCGTSGPSGLAALLIAAAALFRRAR